jgi:2-polyprenyl-3-methyl-5-hydroxy-6-metoxy-1,4-benzoquinol methylase
VENSLERIIPDHLASIEVNGSDVLKSHLERYQYAGRFLLPGNVADVACGTGYGTYMMATECAEKINIIVGIDIDESAIAYARTRYAHSKIKFIVSDAMQFRSPIELNNIVSLETLEHLPDPGFFIQSMSKQLLTGARFIASAPITPSMDANPYHLHDFSKNSFRTLFTNNGFKEINAFIQVQRYDPFLIMRRNKEGSRMLRRNILKYYLNNPNKLLLRLRSLILDGFSNKYLVAVFEKL